ERHHPLLALEHGAEQAVRRDADHPPVRNRDGPEAARGIAVEPPVELLAGHAARPPRLAEESQVVVTVRRLVQDELVTPHLVEVPSAALKMRRACVPATVSFNAIRSHAPERTSSKVRGG